MLAGLESLGIAVPSKYVELSDLAKARGVAPEKFTEGLGTTRMAVAGLEEDTVTLGARAAQMALEKAGIDPSEIALLAVGTETAVDHSKPVASFVQGLLGIPPACRVFETKHACYGGTAALQLALDWIRSGSARGKKAMVICSDIARYGLNTPGEPTQGAGAIALVLSASPRLVAFEAEPMGVYSQDVHDFWRPLYSKDAFVDGHYSVQCYLQALEGAYRAYKAGVGHAEAPMFSDRFAALVYHVPYGKMARKAHRQLRTVDGDKAPDASFDRLVGPSMLLPAQVGNTYTASMYLALASLLGASREDLSGKRVGFFSYGSGMCAEFFTGTVQAGAQEKVKALDLFSLLEKRTPLSISDYEELMRARDAIDTRPTTESHGGGIRYLGVHEHRRTYGK